MNKRILSGMRPTGKLHLGNVQGALSNWVKLQNEPGQECYYMVADWHALTTDYEDTGRIESNVEEMVIDWLSAGLDPKKSVIFRQSWVKEHSELALILSMITPISWLERNPTYKQQIVELQEKDISTHGFLGYPVLQAADILLYKASHVPVGEDQLPHVELTREIARRFNYIYKKNVLPEPAALLSPTPKVQGLDGRKMSKSYGNCIYLADAPAEIEKKIRSMYTDPLKIRANDPGHPEPCPENEPGCVVYAMHKIYEGDAAKVKARGDACRSGALGCVACKKDLLQEMTTALKPMQERRKSFEGSPALVKDILIEGSRKAGEVARRTIDAVKSSMGFARSPMESPL